MINLEKSLILFAKQKYQKELKDLSATELHNVVSQAVMAEISDRWATSEVKHNENKRAYYLSAEFLVGRAIYNNLFCLKKSDEVAEILKKYGSNINLMEEVEDAALGNGGLGRLAACFLDSAATLALPLDGYGIRYKFFCTTVRSIENHSVVSGNLRISHKGITHGKNNGHNKR